MSAERPVRSPVGQPARPGPAGRGGSVCGEPGYRELGGDSDAPGLPGAEWQSVGIRLAGRRGARRRGRPGAFSGMAARFGPGARTRGLSIPLAGR